MQAHAHFDQCPVRDFVPLLVERRARGVGEGFADGRGGCILIVAL
jgi:hypothetical protein